MTRDFSISTRALGTVDDGVELLACATLSAGDATVRGERGGGDGRERAETAAMGGG